MSFPAQLIAFLSELALHKNSNKPGFEEHCPTPPTNHSGASGSRSSARSSPALRSSIPV